jgi:hypothetical protein
VAGEADPADDDTDDAAEQPGSAAARQPRTTEMTDFFASTEGGRRTPEHPTATGIPGP